MATITTTFHASEVKESPVSFDLDKKLTTDGKGYLSLDNPKYHIALFPAKVEPVLGARSQIKFNARVTMKEAGITFHMPVRQLVDDGSLIAGQRSAFQSKRTVVSDWNAKTSTSYERLAIPDENYRELMAMITAADQA
ncbi:MAG: hypothetical protein AB2L13_19450 [Spirochaetota bacterium]